MNSSDLSQKFVCSFRRSIVNIIILYALIIKFSTFTSNNLYYLSKIIKLAYRKKERQKKSLAMMYNVLTLTIIAKV